MRNWLDKIVTFLMPSLDDKSSLIFLNRYNFLVAGDVCVLISDSSDRGLAEY